MSGISLSSASTADTTRTELTSQTIDGGLSTGQPAYYDTNAISWKKATSGAYPQGVFVGSGTIVLSGRATGLSGLSSGSIYWLADSGGVTNDASTSASKAKIGYAESSTVMLVDLGTEGSKISDMNIVLESGDYHYIIESIPDASTSARSGISAASTVNLEGHFDSGSGTLAALGLEYYHIVTIGGSVDESFTGTGSEGAVGTKSDGNVQRCAQRFVVATGGSIDQIVINVGSLLDGGAGATDVVMEIRAGHTIESGAIKATSPKQDLLSTGVKTFTDFV